MSSGPAPGTQNEKALCHTWAYLGRPTNDYMKGLLMVVTNCWFC